jgi:hypothetical protein
MHQAEAEAPDPALPIGLGHEKVFQRDPNDRRRNQRLDDAVGDCHP